MWEREGLAGSWKGVKDEKRERTRSTEVAEMERRTQREMKQLVKKRQPGRG